MTSPHNASGCKGEKSLTTEHLKYHSQSSSRYRKGTSNQRNNRSRSHSQTQSKRNQSRSLSRSKERKRQRQRSHSNDSRIFTHTKSKGITDHDHVQLIQRIFTHTKSKGITDHDHIQLIQRIFTHTNKEHYRLRTPSRSKARGSHCPMYSGFYSSDIVQRKHHPRSLSCLPIRSRKNCYKLSDTSPQKPCETSQS